jgi:hypothetical protein
MCAAIQIAPVLLLIPSVHAAEIAPPAQVEEVAGPGAFDAGNDLGFCDVGGRARSRGTSCSSRRRACISRDSWSVQSSCMATVLSAHRSGRKLITSGLTR